MRKLTRTTSFEKKKSLLITNMLIQSESSRDSLRCPDVNVLAPSAFDKDGTGGGGGNPRDGGGHLLDPHGFDTRREIGPPLVRLASWQPLLDGKSMRLASNKQPPRLLPQRLDSKEASEHSIRAILI